MLFNVPDDEMFEIKQKLESKKTAGRGQLVQLLVLLLLIAVFAYIYFFTGLIRPKPEAPKPPETVAEAIKKPVPPRPEAPEGAVPAAPAPAPQPEQKPAPPAAPAPAKEAKPAPPAAKPTPPQEPAKAAKPEAPAARKAAAKPAPAKKEEAKKEVAVAKPEAAKPAPAPKAEPKPQEKPAPAPKAAPSTVIVGEFVGQKAFDAAEAKLKKAGLKPKVTKLQKKSTMNRLHVGVFNDEAGANAEAQKLQEVTKDVFVLPENGKYEVYAGSYANAAAAGSEKARLAKQGVEVSIRKVALTMPVFKVTLGGFRSSDAARKEAQKLKKLGFRATVVSGK